MRSSKHQVQIGSVVIGAGRPVAVQSMTNTDTADVAASVKQVKSLAAAGSEIVRLTVNNEAAAKAIAKIKEHLLKEGCAVPLVGCFHYNGHTLLTEFPECAEALDKYRINPGNVGFGEKRDRNFEIMVEAAIKYNKPVRIGVNWGSLDQTIAQKLMDENARASQPKSSREVLQDALVESALSSAKRAEEVGLPPEKIVISAKASQVQDLVAVYQQLARRSGYVLHLGLTEAGMGSKGTVASTAACAVLLQQGIGDTIRVSLTPEPGQDRATEVKICQQILQSLELRSFTPQVSSCPGCGRTTSDYFQRLAADIEGYIASNMPVWKRDYPGVEELKIAVMGCIVNGPGESKHADIGISLPGSGENPVAPVFIDGMKAHTLRGEDIASQFKGILLDYVTRRFSNISA